MKGVRNLTILARAVYALAFGRAYGKNQAPGHGTIGGVKLYEQMEARVTTILVVYLVDIKNF
jgi:hypothetical protein